ncbi:MAG: glycosyltransferase family 2 protein [Nanoarchaeota archaeon]
MNLSIIVPCYNEEQEIPNLATQLNPVIEQLKEDYNVELIFVDDGSTDQTNQLLHEHFDSKTKTKIIKHEKNKNLGAAMRTGFAHATGDYIATIDSDCTYNPRLLIPMLQMLDKDTDIVTVSPYHPEGKVENVPGYRVFLGKSISSIYRLITKKKIHTFTALFRVQKREVIENVPFQSDTFLATAEMLVYSLMKGYKVKEFPATLTIRKFGSSKMKFLQVIRSHQKFVFKLLKSKIKKKS